MSAPYSTETVVGSPPGSTFAPTVRPVREIALGASIETTDGGGHGRVVKRTSLLAVWPVLFVATTR